MRARALAVALATAAIAMANAAAASAAALYVDDSGTDAGDCTVPGTPCQTIEYAHDQPGTADVIHLGGGTYAESVGLTDAESLIEDSGFGAAAAGAAVIDNSVWVGDASLAALTLSSTGTVSGLTIVSDYRGVTIFAAGTLSGNTFAFDAPSGPYNADVVVESIATGSPAITGNTFIDPNPEVANPAQTAVVLNSPGSPTVSGNSFAGFQTAILALTGGAATPTISDNTITGTHDTTFRGTGISIFNGVNATLVGNSIHSPGAGVPFAVEIFNSDGSPPAGATLRRNRIIGHQVGVSAAGNALPVTLSSDLIAKANGAGLITGELGSQGVGAAAANVTVVDTISASDVIVGDGTVLTLDSSIVGAGTPFAGVSGQGDAICTITFSRGTGVDTGTGSGCSTGFTTAADPMFVSAPGNDYHLLAGSPMIDAGNTAVPPIGTLDIDGDLRGLSSTPACTPSAGRRDIGADEFVPAPPADCTPSVTPPTTTPPKKCKKGRKLKKGKCVKKKRRKKK